VVAIIPAYNAAGSVGRVVEATRAVVDDVVVVDDGSTDETAEEAEEAGATVLRIPTNTGKGAALLAAFAHAMARGAPAVVTLDADGQHDPAQIPVLVDCWRRTGAHLVIGSRQRSEGEMLPIRRFGNHFARAAISFLAGVPVPDTQTGFRLYDAKLLEAVRLRGTGYELESEVIVKAARAGFRIESVPIGVLHAEGSGTSHYRAWRDTARICLAVLRSRFRR
jgi:glycosyltransferase involved in cell wall biosynthesis